MRGAARIRALVRNRITGIVSRGGGCWRNDERAQKREFPVRAFRRHLQNLQEDDVSFSLGDGLRPDASPMRATLAQFAELKVLGATDDEGLGTHVQ